MSNLYCSFSSRCRIYAPESHTIGHTNSLFSANVFLSFSRQREIQTRMVYHHEITVHSIPFSRYSLIMYSAFYELTSLCNIHIWIQHFPLNNRRVAVRCINLCACAVNKAIHLKLQNVQIASVFVTLRPNC